MTNNYVTNWDRKRFEFIIRRKRNKINQRDIINALHISSNLISEIELGYITPTVELFERMNNELERLIKLKNER
jgi:transcriptional regulator with XRE-family HTH domain